MEDEYIPTALREPEPCDQPCPIKYGIGVEHRPNEAGMFFGPCEDVAECLEHVPAEKGKIFIYELPTGRKLYRWHHPAWHSIKQEGL
jgi:hypothetical protein